MNHRSWWVLAGIALSATLLFSGAEGVLAQSYPSKPLRLIVPYPPGGGGDIVMRVIAQKLSESLGQPVVVDNRSGAAGIIGTEIGAKAAPDGITLTFGTNSTLGIFVSLYNNLPYDPVKDFAPVTELVSAINLLVVNPSVPARNVKELIALAKSKPGRLNYGSAGSGSNAHLSMELFKMMAGVDIEHIPYKGLGPVVTDLLAGRVQMTIANMPPVLAHIKSGKLRAIASTGSKRSVLMPELATVAESGLPGYESTARWGLLVPAGTPKPIIARLNAEMLKILHMPDVKERLFGLGVEPVGNTPEEYAAAIKTDILKWSKVVKESGARVE